MLLAQRLWSFSVFNVFTLPAGEIACSAEQLSIPFTYNTSRLLSIKCYRNINFEEQKAIYRIVLDAQAAAIAVAKPGNHWNDPHEASVRVITQGLLDLGLLQGELDTLITEEAYKPFYMHRIGHWLGMDVHDVGDYKPQTEDSEDAVEHLVNGAG